MEKWYRKLNQNHAKSSHQKQPVCGIQPKCKTKLVEGQILFGKIFVISSIQMTPSKVATKIATIASCRKLAYLSALTKLVILCKKIQEYLQLTFGLLINTNQGNLEQKSGLQVASSPIYAILCQFVRKKSKIFKSGNWVINQDLIRLFWSKIRPL